MATKFTDDLRDFILNNYNLMKAKDLSLEVWNRFGHKMSEQTIRSYVNKYGVSKLKRFTYDEKEWIKQNWSRFKNNVELTLDFNNVFDSNRSVLTMKNLLKRLVPDSKYGWSGGRKVGEGYSTTAKCVGSETFKGGYWWIKIDNHPLPKNYTTADRYKNWKQKHIYLWEQYHQRSVPEGCKIVFLDGNRDNFDIDNLYCADICSLIYLMRNKLWSSNKELTYTSILWAELRTLLSGHKLKNKFYLENHS